MTWWIVTLDNPNTYVSSHECLNTAARCSFQPTFCASKTALLKYGPTVSFFVKIDGLCLIHALLQTVISNNLYIYESNGSVAQTVPPSPISCGPSKNGRVASHPTNQTKLISAKNYWSLRRPFQTGRWGSGVLRWFLGRTLPSSTRQSGFAAKARWLDYRWPAACSSKWAS